MIQSPVDGLSLILVFTHQANIWSALCSIYLGNLKVLADLFADIIRRYGSTIDQAVTKRLWTFVSHFGSSMKRY